jgi:hypothetical protein
MKVSGIARVISSTAKQNKVSALRKAAAECMEVLSSTGFEDVMEMELDRLTSEFEDELHPSLFALRNDPADKRKVKGSEKEWLRKPRRES